MEDALKSLHTELLSFNKSMLKITETRITTRCGRIMLEKKDDAGQFSTTPISTNEQGYVGDVWRDVQVGEVMPGLIMGSQDVAQDLEILEKYKVTHILNVATGVENAYLERFVYKEIRLPDLPESDLLSHLDEAFEFIDRGRETGCVLVHCNAGVSRAAAVVIAYLMKTRQMTFLDGYWYLKEKRSVICPNSGFVSQLQAYEQMLREKEGS